MAVDDSHLDRIQQVAEDLRDRGLEVDRTLTSAGTVTGRVPQSKIQDLEHVEGVLAVEKSRVFQLPPPDAEIQ